MTDQQQPDEVLSANAEIDQIIKNADKRATALRSEDYVLRVAARINGGAHPEMSAAERENVRLRVRKAASQLPKVSAEASRRRSRSGGGGGGIFATLFRSLILIALIIGVLYIGRQFTYDLLPTDTAYIAKQQYERVELLLATNSTAQVSTHLNQAEARLNEFDRLPEDATQRPSLLNQAAASLDAARLISNESLTFEIDDALRAKAIGLVQRLAAAIEDTDFPDGIPAETTNALNAIIDRLSEIEDQDIMEMVIETPEPAETPVEATDEPTPEPEATEDDSEEEVTPETEATPEATEAEETPTLEPTEEANIQYVAQTTDGQSVNVRAGGGTDFPVVAFVPPGTAVEVLETFDDTDWVRVRLEDDTEGWIADFLLTSTAP